MGKFIISHKYVKVSDIVSLLNLPRKISEYTTENIGEIIKIPYNDLSKNFYWLMDALNLKLLE